MLVLARKPEELIKVGDSITIKVLAIKNGQVKLGIEAPATTRVYRGEIYEQVQAQNALASRTQKRLVSEAAAQLAQRIRNDPPNAK